MLAPILQLFLRALVKLLPLIIPEAKCREPAREFITKTTYSRWMMFRHRIPEVSIGACVPGEAVHQALEYTFEMEGPECDFGT